MLDRIWRYCCGYVTFKTENGFPERLINLCSVNNISLSRMKKTPEGLCADTTLINYNKLKKLAHKANVDVYIINKKGVPITALKYKKRFGIIAGIIVFFALLFISQCFVWEISISGNEKVSKNQIIHELSEQGIHKFSYIPSLNFREKKQQLLLRLPQLSWITVNISGCKLEVTVTERKMPPVISSKVPCDIVAAKAGQLRYMEVYNGVSLVKSGYAVKQGEKLVSGVFNDKDGKEIRVHSDAKIIAEVQFDKQMRIDIDQLAKEYTGKKKTRYSIDFLSVKIPLYLGYRVKGSYDVVETKSPMVFFSKELPFGIIKKEYSFYEKKSEALTTVAATEILRKQFLQYEQAELKDCAINSRKEVIDRRNGVISMTVSYIIEQDIAMKVLIE